MLYISATISAILILTHKVGQAKQPLTCYAKTFAHKRNCTLTVSKKTYVWTLLCDINYAVAREPVVVIKFLGLITSDSKLQF